MKVINDFQGRVDRISQLRLNEREPAMVMSGLGDLDSAQGNAYGLQDEEKLSFHDMDDDMKEYFYAEQAEKREVEIMDATDTVKTMAVTSDQLAPTTQSNKKRNLVLGGLAAVGVFFFLKQD